MPLDQKKAFDEQQKALREQQQTITTLLAITAKQSKAVGGLLEETREQGKRSGRQGTLSLILAISAIAIAGVAAWFSYQNYKSDEVWQQEQIGVLKDIRDSIDIGE